MGGIKEKMVAAQRSGIKTVIMPEGCRAEYEELPAACKEGIEVLFVQDYHEVYRLAFDEPVSTP